MIKTQTIYLFWILLLVSGCATSTLEKAAQSGKSPLNSREIFDIVSGNTMSLAAYDFSGKVYFSENGLIAAIDNNGQQDTGSWDIKDNNSLCMKFKVWYYSDIKCYSLLSDQKPNSYSFFTSNGSAYYRGTLHTGDTARLGKTINNKKSTTYLRTQFAAEKSGSPALESNQSKTTIKPEPTSALNNNDTGATVRHLAQDCPDCNLAGTDLKEAHLVNANLAGANLSGANLSYANLRRAKLVNADLSGANLNHANLPGADLRNCNLRNADLSGANLLLADFTGADLTGALLTNAYTEKTKGLEK